jgi:hypothetical protein
VRTGQQVFSFPDGAFNPVVCDAGAIYLVGYSKIYQLLPTSTAAVRPRPRRPGGVHASAKSHTKPRARRRSRPHKSSHRSSKRRK